MKDSGEKLIDLTILTIQQMFYFINDQIFYSIQCVVGPKASRAHDVSMEARRPCLEETHLEITSWSLFLDDTFFPLLAFVIL